MDWVLVAMALVLLALGLVMNRANAGSDDRQSAAIVCFIVCADLLVFAINAALV